MTAINKRWQGAERLNWLCAFLYYRLQNNDLKLVPALVAGYRSVGRSLALREHELALANLRRVCGGLNTQAALRSAAIRYNSQRTGVASGIQRLFTIDEKTLAFRPLFDGPIPDIEDALIELYKPWPDAPHEMRLANVGKNPTIMLQYAGQTVRFPIEGLPSGEPPCGQHPTTPRTRSAIKVDLEALSQEAQAMDRIDVELQVDRPGNWEQRLMNALLETPNAAGTFDQALSLELDGLTHLIGLPGAGKTSLLMCLAMYLSRHGLKTAIFFPSIEVCRQYLEDLRRYGASAGLLVGQGSESRRRHNRKLAEALASEDPLGGFAKTTPVAGLFEGNCVLPDFTSAPTGAVGPGQRFCTQIEEAQPNHRAKDQQNGEAAPPIITKTLCPLWKSCGMNTAADELVDATIWLGHIRSADTKVPAHTTPFKLQYFELLGRSFDVVIFDEADGVQQNLDSTGIAELRLSGYKDSFHLELHQQTLARLAYGRNSALRDRDFLQFAMEVADFERLSMSVVHAIQTLDRPVQGRYRGLLLTPHRLLSTQIDPEKRKGLVKDAETHDRLARKKDGATALWEMAAIEAFYDRFGTSKRQVSAGRDLERAASHLNRTADEADKVKKELVTLFRQWLVENEEKRLEATELSVQKTLAEFLHLPQTTQLTQTVRLLIAVTFTIFSYRRLSPRLSRMQEEGIGSTRHQENLCSDAMHHQTADNILGGLSGVRFFVDKAAGAAPERSVEVRLQYVIFRGAPRTFLYHLHEWPADAAGEPGRGPAVLLTSATSYLAPSSSHHINVRPKYILRPKKGGDQFAESRFVFRPIADPQDPERFLQFSGQALAEVRLRTLEKMVMKLLDGGLDDSPVAQDIGGFDVRAGQRRNAAFVVNSYEQSRHLKRFIASRYPAWNARTVAVVDETTTARDHIGYITSSQVEKLGDDPNWDLLIFPMAAIGRGTNVVFTSGPRVRDAAIGSFYFLTRPHPAPDDLGFLISLAGRASLNFDQTDFSSTSTAAELASAHSAARRQAYGHVGRLLRHPLAARALGNLFEPFTANCAVSLLQTIGRGMRNSCPVQCFFVDLAWAPNSAYGKADTPTESMLAQLIQLLHKCVGHEDPREAAIYQELFGAFLKPLSTMEGLVLDVATVDQVEEPFEPGPMSRLDDDE